MKQLELKAEVLPLLPNSNLLSDWEKMERIVNRLTGLNRFQNLAQRTLRMHLRVSFLEQALVGLAKHLQSLKTLSKLTRKKSMTKEDLVTA